VEYREVGPFRLSAVGVGTAPLGADPSWYVAWPKADEREAVATIHRALELGVNWIDTAPFYGWGRAETLVGRALAGRRDDVNVFTKCGTFRNPDGSSREDHRPQSLRADLEQSLLRLGVGYVDLLQLHDPDPAVPIEESWGAVHELITEGKVRHGGLSNHGSDLVERARAVAPVATLQHQLSLLARGVERDVLPLVQDHRLGLLCWSPLASGFLADDFDVERLGADDFRRLHAFASLDLAPLRATLARIGRVHDRSAAQVAVAWVLSRTSAAAAIVGVRNERDAEELPRCAGFRLHEDELRELATAAPPA
jgi:aryl-alcohol dehydrogenase-like predicted oxidoreductase